MARRSWPFVQRVRDKWRGWIMVAGRRRYLPLHDTAEEASDEAIEIRKGMRNARTHSTLASLADDFLAEIRATRRHGTWAYYCQQLDGVMLAIGKTIPVACITASVLRELIRKHQDAEGGSYSAQTIQHRRAALRRLFRWAKKRGLAGEDPTELVEWPRVEQHAFDVLPESDMRAMLQRLQAVPADFDLVAVALYTGMRRGDLARLRVADVDLEAGTFWTTGKRRREPAPIPVDVAASFECMVRRAREAGREHLLPRSQSNRGPKKEKARPLTETEAAERERGYTVTNTFRRWAKKLGDRRFHPHTLRHTLATSLIRAGVDHEAVRRILRHSSFQTTQRYVHLVAADQRKAMARLRLLPGGDAASEHG